MLHEFIEISFLWYGTQEVNITSNVVFFILYKNCCSRISISLLSLLVKPATKFEVRVRIFVFQLLF